MAPTSSRRRLRLPPSIADGEWRVHEDSSGQFLVAVNDVVLLRVSRGLPAGAALTVAELCAQAPLLFRELEKLARHPASGLPVDELATVHGILHAVSHPQPEANEVEA